MTEQQCDVDLDAAVEAFHRIGRLVGDAVEALGAAFVRMADGIAAALNRQMPRPAVVVRAEARARYGGSGDLLGLWQSSACAGWLHESCPADPLIDCRCTCHGGELR